MWPAVPNGDHVSVLPMRSAWRLILKPEPGRRRADLCSASRRSPALLLPGPVEEVVAGSEQPTLLAGRL